MTRKDLIAHNDKLRSIKKELASVMAYFSADLHRRGYDVRLISRHEHYADCVTNLIKQYCDRTGV
jgi:hypothetical protein